MLEPKKCFGISLLLIYINFNTLLMKKIFFVLAGILLFISCEKDESLDPRPLLVEGEYVTLDIKKFDSFIDSKNLTASSFKGLINTPSNNIVKYELFIRRKNRLGNFENGDFKLFKTISAFPYELVINPETISNFYEIGLDRIEEGEIYQFIGYSYDANGNKFGFSNLSRTVQTTESMKQGYRFKTGILDGSNLNNYEIFQNYILD